MFPSNFVIISAGNRPVTLKSHLLYHLSLGSSRDAITSEKDFISPEKNGPDAYDR